MRDVLHEARRPRCIRQPVHTKRRVSSWGGNVTAPRQGSTRHAVNMEGFPARNSLAEFEPEGSGNRRWPHSQTRQYPPLGGDAGQVLALGEKRPLKDKASPVDDN
eukprot:9493709-Pyramimonas_sp.AAC.2